MNANIDNSNGGMSGQAKPLSHNEIAVREMYEKYEFALLGRFYAGSRGDFGLTAYAGQTISSCEYDFCIPKYDRLLVDLLEEWSKELTDAAMSNCVERINNLGGVVLVW